MSGAAELCACGCGRPVWRWRLAEYEAQSLAGICLGKTRFVSEARAAAYARPRQGSYLCPVCDHWHNGNMAHVSPAKRATVPALLERLRANGNGWIIRQLAIGFASMDRRDWKNRGRHTAKGRAAL